MSKPRGRQTATATRGAPALAPASLPVRTISGEYFRHTTPSRDARDIPSRARAAGRYHRKRDEPPLYASSSEQAAWGELFRHTEPEISPFEVRRRMSKLRVSGLPVLDLTDPTVRELLGVSEKNLTSNRYADCRRIADLARSASGRFGGILAPSAADSDETTLVVFRDWTNLVDVTGYRVGTPPRSLLKFFLRVIESLPRATQDAFQDVVEELTRRAKHLRP